MSTRGHQVPSTRDQNQVCPTDLRKAVGDNEGRATFGCRINGALDLILGGGIDGRGRIVQDQNARIGQKGPGQGQTLTLPTGKGHTAFPDDGLVALAEGVDELFGLGGAGGADNLILGGTGFAKGDVIRNRTREQEDILFDDGDVAAQNFEVPVACHPPAPDRWWYRKCG